VIDAVGNPQTLFDDPAFTVTEVGPFTVVGVAL